MTSRRTTWRKLAFPISAVTVGAALVVAVWLLTPPGMASTPSAGPGGVDPASAFATCLYRERAIDGPDGPTPLPPNPQYTPTKMAWSVSMYVGAAKIDVDLDSAMAPCAVASFVHLTGGAFYNGAVCTRAGLAPELSRVAYRCGVATPASRAKDPSYEFVREAPPATDYSAGTVALWHEPGRDLNGGEFLVFTATPPTRGDFTVVGRVTEPSLAALAAITSPQRVVGPVASSPPGGDDFQVKAMALN